MQSLFVFGAFLSLLVETHAQPPTLGFEDTAIAKPAIFPAAPAVESVPPFIILDPIGPRFTIRADVGDGPGYDNGYTYFESFLPLLEIPGRWLVFNNLRVVNFHQNELWEFNGGFGLRRFNPTTERVLGLHAHYDGRTTLNDNFFHQATLGWESLGPWLDFRNNFYIPAGRRDFLVGQSSFFDPRFVGHNIILSQNQLFESSMGGFDAEVGSLLPGLEAWNVRGYVGCYHYSGSGLPDIDGVRGRVEANINERLTLHAGIQNDDINDTTVTGGLAFHFGPGRKTRSLPGSAPYARMGERVVRDPNIVMAQQMKLRQELATDPKTGQPILVRHANSGAVPGGDGTVERPYLTLPDLQAGALPREILFVHANSVFSGQGIVLQDGQRFLGEGLPYSFTSRQGTFALPRATAGSFLPIIQNSLGNTVALASNVELGGFSILNAGRSAIRGSDISNVYLHDLTIVDPARHGISLRDVAGSNRIADSSITGAGGSGILIELGGDTNGSYLLTGNRIENTADCGLVLSLGDNARGNLNAIGNQFLGIQCNGIRIDAFNQSVLNTVLANNVFRNNAVAGILFDQFDQSTVTATVADNTFEAHGPAHLGIFLGNDARGTYAVTGNKLTDSFDAGIDVALFDKAQADVTLIGNVIEQSVFTGVRFETYDRSILAARVASNAIRDTEGFGLSFGQYNRSQITAKVLDNVIERSDLGILDIGAFEQAKGDYLIAGNTFRDTMGDGVYFFLRDRSETNVVFQNNAVSLALWDGAHIDLDDKAVLTALVTGNRFQENLGTGLHFVQQGQSTAVGRILGNTFVTNDAGHAQIDLGSRSTGLFQFARNSMQDGAADGLTATTDDKANLGLQVFGNTSNRSFIFNELSKSTFLLEDTAPTNTLTAPAITVLDPSITIIPFGDLGFPNP